MFLHAIRSFGRAFPHHPEPSFQDPRQRAIHCQSVLLRELDEPADAAGHLVQLAGELQRGQATMECMRDHLGVSDRPRMLEPGTNGGQSALGMAHQEERIAGLVQTAFAGIVPAVVHGIGAVLGDVVQPQRAIDMGAGLRQVAAAQM